MKNEESYKKEAEAILRILVDALRSLGVKNGGIYATVYFLKTPEQRYLLMDWIANLVESNYKPSEGDIMEKV